MCGPSLWHLAPLRRGGFVIAAAFSPNMVDVVILEFMRSPNWFESCILTSDLLAECRDEMLAVGRVCFFGEGAKVLATPADVHHILHALDDATGKFRFEDGFVMDFADLKPRHVVLSLSLEAVLFEALAATPGTGSHGGKARDNVKVKRRACLTLPYGPWQWDIVDYAGFIRVVDDFEDEDTDADDDDDSDNDVDAIVAMSSALLIAISCPAEFDDFVRVWHV
jgi:hypothetical protein